MLQQTPADDTSPLSELVESTAFTEFIEAIYGVLNFTLFPVGGQDVTVVTLLIVALMLLASWWISRGLQRAIASGLQARGVTDPGTTAVARRLLHYGVMVVGAVIAIEQVGIDVTALFAAGAIFAAALAFAMQSVAENFVSGVILLVERDIRNGDILEVDGRDVQIIRMGIRTTIARSRNDEDLIIPNAALTQDTVKSYTLGDQVFRIRVGVGVTYDSDMREVRRILEWVGENMEERFKGREPVVQLRDFGSSSVEWELSIWSDRPWRAPNTASQLREAIWWRFEEAGIEIAFPQLDLHFDPPVEEAFGRLPRSA